MQQKDAHFGGELGHSDAASSYGVGPSSSGAGSMSAPMHGMLFQQPPGTYVPMMPPMMMGGSMMGGNPGSSPVTARKSTAPAANEDVSLRPVRNFAPLLKPKTPAMLPYSAQSSSTTRPQVCIIAILCCCFLKCCHFSVFPFVYLLLVFGLSLFGISKCIWPVKMSYEVLAWLSVWSEVK